MTSIDATRILYAKMIDSEFFKIYKDSDSLIKEALDVLANNLQALEIIKEHILINKDKHNEYYLYSNMDPEYKDGILTEEEYSILKHTLNKLWEGENNNGK